MFRLAILVCLLFSLLACRQEPAEFVDYFAKSQKLESEKTELVSDWNLLLLDLVKHTKAYEAPVTARAIAYFNLALYESIRPGTQSLKSYSGLLQDFQVSLNIENSQYHWLAAANASCYNLVEYFFSGAEVTHRLKAKTLFEKYRLEFLSTWPEQTILRSEELGRHIANQIQNYASGDGGHNVYLQVFYDYKSSHNAYEWYPIGSPAQAMLPKWGNNRTFFKGISQLLAPAQPINFSIEKTSPFYGASSEIERQNPGLDLNNILLCNYWIDSREQNATSAGHSLNMLIEILNHEKINIEQYIEILSKCCLAISDAYVVSFLYKYQYIQVSPMQYITKEINPNWQPYFASLPYPDYPSADAVQKTAWASILAHHFGDQYSFTDHSNDSRTDFTFKPRYFNSFSSMSNEASLVGLMSGTHYRHSIYSGIQMGAQLAEYTSKMQIKNQ